MRDILKCLPALLLMSMPVSAAEYTLVYPPLVKDKPGKVYTLFYSDDGNMLLCFSDSPRVGVPESCLVMPRDVSLLPCVALPPGRLICNGEGI